MVKGFSEITLQEALDRIQCWLPVQIWIDGKLEWDDNLAVDGDWIPYDTWLKYIDPMLYFSPISSVDIEVTDFHHSIIQIYTQVRGE